MRGLELLPDGKHLVTMNGPHVHYWDLESGLMVNDHSFTPKKAFGAKTKATKFVPAFMALPNTAVAPDGKTFAAIISGEIYIQTPFDFKGTPEYAKLKGPFGSSKDFVGLGFVRVGENTGDCPCDR